jgi:hypothetical protein
LSLDDATEERSPGRGGPGTRLYQKTTAFHLSTRCRRVPERHRKVWVE